MPNNKQNVTKFAPIFGLRSNKSTNNVIETNGKNRSKRKKKSSKSESKLKLMKKFDNCLEIDSEESVDCRRSQRLRHKELKFCYNETKDEDIDEEMSCDKSVESFGETEDKNNESIVLIEENSNTIDYWIDSNRRSHGSDDTDEDIELIESDNMSKPCSQETIEEQRERLLWTEKYKPTTGSEVVGHKVAVNHLKSWLEDWNNRNVGNSRAQKGSDEDSDADNCVDESNACLLICGPTGSGKTSMIYAIAEELKYEVLELNASMKRNGRVISRVLGEATQSHQMLRNNEPNGSAAHSIQLFFHSISRNDIKVENDLKGIKSKKSKPKPKGILNYFTKQTNNSIKSSSNSEEIEIIESKEMEIKAKIEDKSETTLKSNENQSNDCLISLPKVLSIATNSLILFDDIDVMIDEDYNGFWSALNRINDMTKKPVILTATQYVPYIRDCVKGLQVLSLNKPNVCQTVDVLKSICDKEFDDKQMEKSERVCHYLSTTYDNDIRRCINELQFGSNDWANDEEEEEIPKTQAFEPIEEKPNSMSYYNSIAFLDAIETQFNILSVSQNRNLWMNCRPTYMENETQSIGLAKDIADCVNDLNNKLNKCLKICELSEDFEKPIDCESIESISGFLDSNTNLRTILLDYCPYLSFICDSESKRQTELANHSRRSRRFMHHLDSIGFYIDDSVKTKLISAFVPISDSVLEDIPKQMDETICIKDDDFYD